MQMMGADRLKNETMAEVKDGFKPGGFVHMFADGQRKDIMSDFKKVATKDLMKQVIRYVVIPLASAMLLIFAALVVIIVILAKEHVQDGTLEIVIFSAGFFSALVCMICLWQVTGRTSSRQQRVEHPREYSKPGAEPPVEHPPALSTPSAEP